jgi:hypothetical protein
MEEEIKSRKSIENAQIKEIRKDVEALLANPEFEKMSKAFQNSVAKRLGLKELKGSGIVPQARIPVTLGYILKAANITDMEKLKGLESIPITLGDLLKAANITDMEKLKGLESIQVMYAADWPPFEDEEAPYSYYNVYSYSNW